MKKIELFSLVVLMLSMTIACQKSTQNTEKPAEVSTEQEENDNNTIPDGHNSRISLDWNGIYQGAVPCADCEGIQTKIILFKDGTFERTMIYLGRSEERFVDKGNFEWNADNSSITLLSEKYPGQQYMVGENVLFHLDQEGNRITGDLADHYKLKKNKTDTALEDKTWVLIELLGQPIDSQEARSTMSLKFMSDRGLLAGSDGCNRFNGPYELLNGNRFKAGPFATTLMACENMDNAKAYLDVLEKSDTYILTDSLLSITKARMAPMAKFKMKEEE